MQVHSIQTCDKWRPFKQHIVYIQSTTMLLDISLAILITPPGQ